MCDKDNWAHRDKNMRCRTCLWYKPKGRLKTTGRCRKHAPTLDGWPVVFPDDWCGDHKLADDVINLNNVLVKAGGDAKTLVDRGPGEIMYTPQNVGASISGTIPELDQLDKEPPAGDGGQS